MTNEEAIKKMKECSVFEFDYNADIDEWLDCLEVAINALEKQVPKKPIKFDGVAYCPNCMGIDICFYGDTDGNDIPWEYCASCGQRLDWTEDE